MSMAIHEEDQSLEDTAYWRFVAVGIIEVRENGTIWRHQRWNVSKQDYEPCDPFRIDTHRSRNGYLRFPLRIDGRAVSIMAHRMVYRVFYGPILEGMEVNHVNRVRWDNRPENLNVLTPQENTHYAYAGALGRDEQGRYMRKEHANDQ